MSSYYTLPVDVLNQIVSLKEAIWRSRIYSYIVIYMSFFISVIHLYCILRDQVNCLTGFALCTMSYPSCHTHFMNDKPDQTIV